MAKASATYQWDEDCAVSVSVETEAGFPDSGAEVTVQCRRLLRETACDLASEVAHVDEESSTD